MTAVAHGQWVRIFRLGPPYEVEVIHAHYVQHRFARHAHEHSVIGLVDEGVQQYRYRGATHVTPAGQVFFVNGGEPHTGEPAIHEGYLYRTICISPQAFQRLAADIVGRDWLPHLKGAVADDRNLVAALRRFHCAISTGASVVACESTLLAVFRRLLEAHTGERQAIPPTGSESHAVRKARDFLEAHYAEEVSLAQLGAITGQSPFHLARAFARQLGLPPHAYLESIRIRHARQLLTAGMPVVDTALAMGYPDQSHFTHRFRRLTGITPGQYRASARLHKTTGAAGARVSATSANQHAGKQVNEMSAQLRRGSG